MVFGSKKTDDVERSKTVTRSQTEGGGIYSCTAGSHADEPFTCSASDKEAIASHNREFKHYVQGTAPCAICEQPVNMNEILTLAGRKPIHPDCQQPVEEL